jgi:hypothetical protein
MADRLRDAVEERTGEQLGLFVEWTGLSCWHPHSSIPPHYDRSDLSVRVRVRVRACVRACVLACACACVCVCVCVRVVCSREPHSDGRLTSLHVRGRIAIGRTFGSGTTRWCST